METKHTPGPWKRKAGIVYSVEIISGDGEPIAIADIGRDSCEANARLIAAAPGLLEKLISLVAYNAQFSHDEAGHKKLAAARAEIAKATGSAA